MTSMRWTPGTFVSTCFDQPQGPTCATSTLDSLTIIDHLLHSKDMRQARTKGSIVCEKLVDLCFPDLKLV